jgi:hypothetical protein
VYPGLKSVLGVTPWRRGLGKALDKQTVVTTLAKLGLVILAIAYMIVGARFMLVHENWPFLFPRQLIFLFGILGLFWDAWLLIPVTFVATLIKISLRWLLITEFFLALVAGCAWSVSAHEWQNDMREGGQLILPMMAAISVAIQVPVYYLVLYIRNRPYRQRT